MPLPFIVGGIIAAKAAIGAVAATVAGKVALGTLAGYVFVRVFEHKTLSKKDLIREVGKTERVRELLQHRKSLYVCVEEIIKDQECTVVRVKLLGDNDEAKDLGKIDIKAKRGIVESEVYDGFGWLIER